MSENDKDNGRGQQVVDWYIFTQYNEHSLGFAPGQQITSREERPEVRTHQSTAPSPQPPQK